MNRKNLSILITTAILSCSIGSFVINSQEVQAKELKIEQNQGNIILESEDYKALLKSIDYAKRLSQPKDAYTIYTKGSLDRLKNELEKAIKVVDQKDNLTNKLVETTRDNLDLAIVELIKIKDINTDSRKSETKLDEKKPEVENKDIVEDTLKMLKETREIYYKYKYKFDKNIINEVKNPVENIYLYEEEIKNLNNNPDKLKEYCETNPNIVKLREINKKLREERKKYDESHKVDEKKPDKSNQEKPSNLEAGKSETKPDEKKPEVENKDIVEDTLKIPEVPNKYDDQIVEKEINNKVDIDNSKIKLNENKQKDQSKVELNENKENKQKVQNKVESNENKINELVKLKEENDKNKIEAPNKVMNSELEKKNVKELPKTGEASSLPYIGGFLISLAALLKLNMKKFKKN
ncbi:LPXTG cell wall anchor domain-containing protein [Clostridium sp.]|uniref:LPXTG cell wall anchor domain-containing protein n=1 Tax=Clostridium sp. TaxID=1506 RepID=UPI00261D501F